MLWTSNGAMPHGRDNRRLCQRDVRVKLSEKSLELNVGAELLWLLRMQWGMP